MGKCQSKSTKTKQQQQQQSQKDTSNITINNINTDESNPNNNNTNLNNPTSTHQPTILTIDFTFIEKGEEKHTASFSTLLPIQSLFDEIKYKINKYSDYDILNSNKQSLKSLITEKIYKIFPNETQSELTLFYLGLTIADNIKRAYETNITIIATPLLEIGDKIGLISYNKFTQQTTQCIINNETLSIFTHISSYCNGNNMLYLSGGERSNGYHDAFYAVDLFNTDKIEQLPNLNEARGWHSMLYVPNSFIFIVGGTTKAVEFYDIDRKDISYDSDLNELRREPTLCLVNNALLYCFGGYVYEDEGFSTTVERCNLRKGIRKWDYVNYVKNEGSFFDECYYVSAYYTDNAIVLFRTFEHDNDDNDNNRDNRCYNGIVFDYENDDKPLIDVFNNNNNNNILTTTTTQMKGVFPEKFFIPLSNNCKYIFPMISNNVVLYTCEGNCKVNSKVFDNMLNDLL